MKDRLTIRLGPLSRPLATYCKKHKLSASQLCRRLLAQAIGVPEPDLPPNGFAGMSDSDRVKYGKRAAKSRWES